jgi:hypothetical protein
VGCLGWETEIVSQRLSSVWLMKALLVTNQQLFDKLERDNTSNFKKMIQPPHYRDFVISMMVLLVRE